MNHKKKYLLSALLFITIGAYSQIPEDALRYSFYPQNASARIMAVGGAMGSLGGDISANYVNPAGLGMYRTSELVFTPGYFLNNNSIDFRGTSTQNNKNSLGLGPTGFVFGFDDQGKPNTSHAFSIAISQTANFNNTLRYSGYNNYSSYAEQWAEEFSKSNLSINDAINNPGFAFGTAPALYTYLVDTITVNDTVRIKALPEFTLAQGNALYQQNTVETKGGIYELAISFATNKNDKFLFGGSLGIPILNYDNTTTFSETDTSSNHNNYFNHFTYTDAYSVSGVGFNVKLGAIYKPKEYIRLGLALHTPTYFTSLQESRRTSLATYKEGYANNNDSVSSDLFTSGQPGLNKYNLLTPFKLIASGSYVFRETADITKQKAFITADIEYVDYNIASFSTDNEAALQDELDYFHQLNSVIRNQYKGTFNFRAGGELKFNTIMGRLGFAYYGNPYKDAALKATRTLLSGGIGYRNNGFFIDLTYVYSINKDVNFPYRLEDKANTFSTVDTKRGNIVATLGIKL
ncbi:OmpP1/FadL family transporter [Ferruginibacter albus]|uniref:OmpP1/FadL family transporter n=1 Tax=Ferruginibacter albus TaxID=2875540 RepID=UPI001CC67A7F|nr:hypothetical protein [Ferruginibacter albus]UAY51133.1 hypothetical protein K9M53_11085 [Ferruginibacter albus]